jgi:RNase P subunit RPR2
MLQILPKTAAPSATVRSHCPDCNGALTVLRVIAGRAKAKSQSEYWTMRCTRCGGIHLDILNAPPLSHPIRAPEEQPA